MDVYVLDNLLRRIALVDDYISFVWAERYIGWGDFQLDTTDTRGNRALFTIGTPIGLLESHYVMYVEYVEKILNDEGEAILRIKGRSMEYLLDNRIAMSGLVGLATTPEWKLTGKPAAIAREVFKKICVDKILDAQDGIPFYTTGAWLPAGTIAEPQDTVEMSFEPMSVYAVLKNICEVYDLGFRLIRREDTSQVYFDIYTGSNRTTSQTVLPAVVFSSEMDNLTDISEIASNETLKNVAYVVSKNRTLVVYPDLVDPATLTGYNRRVMVVKVDNVDDIPVGAQLDAILRQRGIEALAKQRGMVAFDGEVPQRSSYIYNKDYKLGDLVEKRNSDGFRSDMRVTEQIFAADATGSKSYPTLSLDMTIIPGTWFSWTANETWVAATKTWIES